MTNADWATRTSTRSSAWPRTRRRPTSRRPTASWPARTTPTPTPATRPPRSASRRSPRPTTSSATPRSASSTTSCARCLGGFGPLPRTGGCRRRRSRSTSTTCSAAAPAAAAAAGSATSSAACSAAAEPHAAARPQPRRGADIETEATIGFADAIEGVTVSLRLARDAPCPDCSGTGAKAGTLPRVCPDCEGVGMRAASVGGAFTMNETCPTCRGRGLVVDDPCPTCHGSGRGMSNRTISGPHPGRRQGRPAHPAQGKGANGERGGPPGDLYVTVKVSPHQLFGRKGDNLTLTVPVTLRRGGARRRHQGADARRRAGHPEDPGRHAQRAHVPGARQGRAAQGRHTGDLLVTVEVQVPAHLDEKAREARRGTPRRDRRRGPARQPVRRRETVPGGAT